MFDSIGQTAPIETNPDRHMFFAEKMAANASFRYYKAERFLHAAKFRVGNHVYNPIRIIPYLQLMYIK